MLLKSLLFACCLALLTSVYADNRHSHPQADASARPTAKRVSLFDYCAIEIINNSYDDVRVFGIFDDGSSLIPFNVYRYDYSHYIDLFYYGYCHAGMDLYIESLSGYPIYSGYMRAGSTIQVIPYFDRKISVEIRTK